MFSDTVRSCVTWRRTHTTRRRRKKRKGSTHTPSGPADLSAASTPTGREPYSSLKTRKLISRVRELVTSTHTPRYLPTRRLIQYTHQLCIPNVLAPIDEESLRWGVWTMAWGRHLPQREAMGIRGLVAPVIATLKVQFSQIKDSNRKRYTILETLQSITIITMFTSIQMSFRIRTDHLCTHPSRNLLISHTRGSQTAGQIGMNFTLFV